MKHSKPKFTQGPWIVAYIEDKPLDLLVVEASNDKPIANIWSSGQKNVKGQVNAALISASPEMYEALEQALMRLQILEINDTTTDIIKHALDKARGAK